MEGPFTRDGRALSFDQGMSLLRDKTGRPGPGTWELALSERPAGPSRCRRQLVRSRRLLPIRRQVAAHRLSLEKAAGQSIFADILRFSNFKGAGSARVGSSTGISAFGASDMAGNVKEWCSNPSGTRRAILGGGWNEPAYMFTDEDAQEPFARGPSYGFRCAVYPTPPPEAAFGPMLSPFGTIPTKSPSGTTYSRSCAGCTPTTARRWTLAPSSVDDSGEYWRKEKVSFRAGYGNERVPAYLFLPRNAKPPYQTVVWGPGGYASLLNSSENGMREEYFSVLLRTGRAVLYPVYKGSYERKTGNTGDNARRDEAIQFVKDASRSVDYLETRPDIQKDRLAYYGLSWGAYAGVQDPCSGAALQDGHAGGRRLRSATLPSPSSTSINFAPAFTSPMLMLNGRFDFVYPLATSQLPLFRFLGTPRSRQAARPLRHRPRRTALRRRPRGPRLARPLSRTCPATIESSMPFQEVVEAEGHLIDSHIMENIFDKVVEYNGRFEVEQFRIGRTNSEPSYLRLKVEDADAGRAGAPAAGTARAGLRAGGFRRRAASRRWSATAARRRTSTPPPITARSSASASSGSKSRTSAWTRMIVVADGRAFCRRLRDLRAGRPDRRRDCAASASRRNRRSATGSRSPSCRTASPPSARWRPPCGRPPRWCASAIEQKLKVVVVAGPVVVHTGGVSRTRGADPRRLRAGAC